MNEQVRAAARRLETELAKIKRDGAEFGVIDINDVRAIVDAVLRPDTITDPECFIGQPVRVVKRVYRDDGILVRADDEKVTMRFPGWDVQTDTARGYEMEFDRSDVIIEPCSDEEGQTS